MATSMLGPMFWHACADARAIGMFHVRGMAKSMLGPMFWHACADARAIGRFPCSRVCMLIHVLGPMFWHACSMPVQREGRAQLRAAWDYSLVRVAAPTCWQTCERCGLEKD